MAADWKKIESDYMANRLSYREIAEKYGVSLSSVARHGRQNGWPEKREQFADRVNTRARSKAEYKKAARRAEALMRLDELAERLLMEMEPPPIDRQALLDKARDRACSGCSARKVCAERNALTAELLEHPLDARCRKPGRLVPELRQAQDQLRSM